MKKSYELTMLAVSLLMKKSYELTMLAVSLLVVLSLGSANAANLVSHWTFDGNLLDSVGGEDGTMQGQDGGPIEYEWVTGHDGTANGALHLTHVATEVSLGVGTTAFSPGTGDFTFTAWVKASDMAGAAARCQAQWGGWYAAYPRLVYNGRWDEGGIGGLFGRLDEANPGQIGFYVYGAPPNGNVNIRSTEEYDDNQWHWYGMRVESGQMTLWIDGEKFETEGTYGANTMIYSGTRDTTFGAYHGDIVFDEFKVWHEALSDTDMYNDYIGFTPAPDNCSQAVAEGYGLATDLNADCYVNWADFSIFAADWLRCMDPENVDCEKPWE